MLRHVPKLAPILAAGLATLVAGCGGGSSSSSSDKPPLTVSAASSLTKAFTNYGKAFTAAHVKLSFGGSDELAAQIRQGVTPDVFASANTKLPDELHADHKVAKPTVFVANRFVVAVPADNPKHIRSIHDLAKPGVTIAAGSPSVPIGSYTRDVLAKLPAGEAKAIEANIKSDEPDVAGIVGKLTQGAVDAGFLYVTDVRATNGKLRAISIPSSLSPNIAYGVAVVTGAKHPEQARKFIAGLLHGKGAQELRADGFLPPPQ